MRRNRSCWLFCFIILILLVSIPFFAFKLKNGTATLDSAVYIAPELRVPETTADSKTITEAFATREGIAKFLSEHSSNWYVTVDLRRGVPTLLDGGAIPFIPGPANSLSWNSFVNGCESIQCFPKEKVELLAREFLADNPDLFPVKQDELVMDPNGTIPIGESFYLLRFQWVVNDIPVEGASIFFRINNGNLIQVASTKIAPVNIDTTPSYTPETAWQILNGYLGEDGLSEKDEILEPGKLVIIPTTVKGMDTETYSGTIGSMSAYNLAYRLAFRRPGTQGTWEAMIDAHSGEILRFVDANRYGRVHGGAKVSDGMPPDEDRPFPFADIGGGLYSDGAGMFTGNNATSTLMGKYAHINDLCGAISNTTTTGDLDFLVDLAAGTDCVVPSGNPAGLGNTHSARTMFYNLTAINLKAQTYNPTNTWLTSSYMTANLNNAAKCNASSGGGVVNFYKHIAGSCNNLGEIPGVAMHEWAHSYDDEDGSGDSCEPVETYADFTAIVQTHNSCTGAGFFIGSFCSGYGDSCSSCTGVRDCDWAKHGSNTPWTSANHATGTPSPPTTVWGCSGGSYNGPCGWEDHCESGISTQAVWDFVYRDLPAECGLDLTTGWMLEDRLWFAGVITLTQSYTCSSGVTDGCSGTVLYSVMRALDDDGDGTANGTPHAHAIYHALQRHLIHCSTWNDASPQNANYTSCPSLNTPVLSGTAGNNQTMLSWTTGGPNATRYFIYKNESGCDVAFNRIAIVTAPTLNYTDTACANGVTYYYRVQAVTGNDSCVSPSSNCISLIPTPCAGAVSMSSGIYNCADTVNVTVSDSTAPASPFNVEAWSTSDTTHQLVQVTGVPSTYTGSFTTTTGAGGPGVVHVANGDTLYVQYTDLDYCGAGSQAVQTTASIDCVGPVISNVNASVSGVSATITWTTDEMSNSKVYYGTVPPTWTTSSDATMVTGHSINLTGLPTCTKYYFWVESADTAGNTASANNGGSYYTFVTGLVLSLVDEDFEGTWGPNGDVPPAGWTIIDNGSESPKVWNANDWSKYTRAAPYINVARIYYSPVETSDDWLVSPAFDIPDNLTAISLQYDHYFNWYSAVDFGYVDYKSDQHGTWVNLATYTADTANMAHETISLLPYLGDTNAQIRFRYVGNNGYSWEVDNVLVEGSGVCATSMGTITLDGTVYMCSGDTISMTIRDTDLSGSATAIVTTSGGDSETVVCTETGLGVFTGTINTAVLPRTVSDNILQVSNGETITATYNDADDGTGFPATVQDTAVTDCAGPVISNVLVTNVGATTARVTWTTSEPANSRVTYGTSTPPGTNQDDLANYVTSHSVDLTGLTMCTNYYLSVTSSDILGNGTTDNNGGSYFTFTTLGMGYALGPVDVESGTTGWTLTGDWRDSTCRAHGGTHAFKAGAVACPGSQTTSSTSDLTWGSDINLGAPGHGAHLKYWEWYYTESGYDDCRPQISTNGGSTWTNLAEYNGDSGGWIQKDYDLAAYSGNIRLRFEAYADSITSYEGWYIDDIEIGKAVSCTAALEHQSHTVTDTCSSGGPGNNSGILEPGEDAAIQVTMRNNGGSGATGVSATLSCSTPGVTITDSSAAFPDIPASGTGSSISPHFTISVDSSVTCVTTANFTLHSTSTENPTGTDSYFTIDIGKAGGAVTDFSENFAGVTVPALPAGWTVYNAGSGSTNWVTYNSYACSSPNNLSYHWDASYAANVWAFTPGIALTAGTTYTLNFSERVGSTSWNEKFEVKCGTAATVAGQTITVLPSATYSSTTCTSLAPTFTVPTTGTYYLSWHCTSDANMFYLTIDDINLTHNSAPTCNLCTGTAPHISYQSHGTITQVTGDGDAWYERGEKWQVQVNLTNDGIVAATNVTATLAGNGITVCTPSKSFGNIGVGGTGSATFEFVIDSGFTPCGGAIGFDITTKSCTEKTPAGADESDVFSINVGQYSSTPAEIVIQPTTADSYINEQSTTTNYGTATTMNVRRRTTRNHRSLVTFSLSGIPAGSTINTAQLELYATAAPTTGQTLDVHYVTNSWVEGTVTWDTPPVTYNATAVSSIAGGTTTGWKTWTGLGPTVSGWFTGSIANNGLLVKCNDETGTTAYLYTFAAKENATTANRPILRVNYTPPGTWDCSYTGTGSCGGCTNPTTPTISSVTDVSACAQSGVTVTFTAGSPSTSNSLMVDTVEAATGITSPYVYNPGNTSSHNYQIRTYNTASCHTDSTVTAGTDVNNVVGAPTISSVTDVDACAQSGVTITWGTVSGATGYDLYVDATTLVTTVTSPYVYNPGNTTVHGYQVRAKNASCTGSYSTSVNGTDVDSSEGAPTISSVTDVDACAQSGVTVTWGAVSGATGYDLYVDATTLVTTVTSPYVYNPGDTTVHGYQVRAKNASCTGSYSTSVNGTDANSGLGTPTISSVTDVDACAQSGVTVTWGAVSGATGYDLYVDATTLVTTVTSPYVYNPGDTSAHGYQVRAKNASCTGSYSTSVNGTDANGQPSTPVISSVVDNSAVVCDGVVITFTTGAPATQHDLYIGAVLVQASITSPYLYVPGDSLAHTYIVRAVNGTCYTDSVGVAGTDLCGSPCAAPVAEVTDDKPPVGDKTQFTWTAIAADNVKVVRGIQGNLAALETSAEDFTCYASALTTSVNISGDDPSIVTGRCYYYLFAGYNCSDSSQYVGPYGLGKGAVQRIVNQVAGSPCTP